MEPADESSPKEEGGGLQGGGTGVPCGDPYEGAQQCACKRRRATTTTTTTIPIPGGVLMCAALFREDETIREEPGAGLVYDA